MSTQDLSQPGQVFIQPAHEVSDPNQLALGYQESEVDLISKNLTHKTDYEPIPGNVGDEFQTPEGDNYKITDLTEQGEKVVEKLDSPSNSDAGNIINNSDDIKKSEQPIITISDTDAKIMAEPSSSSVLPAAKAAYKNLESSIKDEIAYQKKQLHINGNNNMATNEKIRLLEKAVDSLEASALFAIKAVSE